MKILTVIGARPQFVKAAIVSKAISQIPFVTEVIVHTGQHYDRNMSQIFFDEMEIPNPKYNLDVHGLNHGAMTGRMLEGIEEIIIKENPDWILLYGDTNSTVAGALAGSKLHKKIAHVEAGLRSFNMKMPEEINRILTDRLSNVLFCPTKTAEMNLVKEGYDSFSVDRIIIGDVMYDAALFYAEKAKKESNILQTISYSEFHLATIHRAENTDNISRMEEIINTLNIVHSKIPVVMPLHPRTREKLQKLGLKLNFHVIDPVGYLDMLSLLGACKFVITDSGGLQKEAYFFKKPCLTLRDETEWVELTEEKVNCLVGASQDKFFKAFDFFTTTSLDFTGNLYGDGKAAIRIADYLARN